MKQISSAQEGSGHACALKIAIKQNKNESYKSIEDECQVLSRLPDNDHVIRFLGAVIDERELATQPPLVFKMMMELAESEEAPF